MTAQHDDFAALADESLSLRLQLEGLKKQAFDLADDLSMLYCAYDGLQVITARCGADAENVCPVLHGLNCRFQELLARLDSLYARPG